MKPFHYLWLAGQAVYWAELFPLILYVKPLHLWVLGWFLASASNVFYNRAIRMYYPQRKEAESDDN